MKVVLLFVLAAAPNSYVFAQSAKDIPGYAKIGESQAGLCNQSIRKPSKMVFAKDGKTFTISFSDLIDVCPNKKAKLVNFIAAYRGNYESNNINSVQFRFTMGTGKADCRDRLNSRRGFIVTDPIDLEGRKGTITKVTAGTGLEKVGYIPKGFVCFKLHKYN